MTPSLPRLWMGAYTSAAHVWWWDSSAFEWSWQSYVHTVDLFVPGHLPRPTIDPATMRTIETCSEIDWNPTP